MPNAVSSGTYVYRPKEFVVATAGHMAHGMTQRRENMQRLHFHIDDINRKGKGKGKGKTKHPKEGIFFIINRHSIE